MLEYIDLKRPNFSPEEFFASDTAYRLNNDKNPLNNIKNYPNEEDKQEVLSNLMIVADLMQEIRDLLDKPIKINSAYRCKKLNDLVGSTDRSQHLKGQAVDFVCPSFSLPENIVSFLEVKGIIVDQCFNEGSWVHISKMPSKNRMMYGHYLFDAKLGRRQFVAI
jgi:hypothetical protein